MNKKSPGNFVCPPDLIKISH